jgi:hypothetical protein
MQFPSYENDVRTFSIITEKGRRLKLVMKVMQGNVGMGTFFSEDDKELATGLVHVPEEGGGLSFSENGKLYIDKILVSIEIEEDINES